MWKLLVKFYLGKDEDCSLGESISDAPPKMCSKKVVVEDPYIRFW